jgi:hypothetical protein
MAKYNSIDPIIEHNNESKQVIIDILGWGIYD